MTQAHIDGGKRDIIYSLSCAITHVLDDKDDMVERNLRMAQGTLKRLREDRVSFEKMETIRGTVREMLNS